MLTAVVVMGFGAGAGFYLWQAPKAKEKLEAQLAAAPAPEADEERVKLWLEFVAPQIHGKLVTGRLSAQQPWVVTHTVAAEAGEPVVWGVPAEEFSVHDARAEGLRVTVSVPAPRPLIQARLIGNKAMHVPHFEAPGPPAGYADERMRFVVGYFLDGLVKSLAREIEGAELVVELVPGPDPGS